MKTTQSNQQGSVTGILLAFMTLGFFAAAAAAFVLYTNSSNTSDYDSQIAAANQTAKEAVARAELAEQRESEPFRSYVGSDTYGALTFEFPKFWNVYRDYSRNAILNFYAHPREIPGTGDDVNFAFRAQIVNKTYTTVLNGYERDVEDGSVAVRAFKPELVPGEAGVYLTGEIVRNKKGAMVLLPQRDKTFVFWTEADEYIDDFNAVMKTVKYSP